MIEKPHEELLICSDEDKVFFDKCIEGLPTREGFNGDYLDKDGVEIPFGSQGHIVQHFRKTLELVKPVTVLEIGFNLGYSSALWLNLGLLVKSIDISDKKETIVAADTLFRRFVHRFRFEIATSETMKKDGWKYDLAFIDGNHSEEWVAKDTIACLDLGIPYILYDDYYERYGGTKKALVNFPELELVLDMDNLRLYKNSAWHIH